MENQERQTQAQTAPSMARGEQQGTEAGHYKQELARNIGILDAVGMTVSGISPIASVFLIAPVVFQAQGSGVLLSAAIAAVICLGMALCYSELGSTFPVAGGEYAIVARVLGRPLGFVAFVDYLVLALVGPSSLGLGTALYLTVLWPNINGRLAGVVVIVVTTAIALVSIKSNVLVTGIFLVLQLAAVIVISLLGFTHIHQPLSIFVQPQNFSQGYGAPVSLGAIMAGVALAITVYNGYDGPMIFSEEMVNPGRTVPPAILWSLAIAVVAAVLPLIAVLLGTPSLRALSTVANPMSYVLHVLGGQAVDDLVTLSIVLAIFDSSIVGMLVLGRIFYSSGRDKAWPGPISAWMAYCHPRLKTPMVATTFIGIVGAIITAFTTIAQVITFAAFLLVVLYGLVALAALVSRFKQRDLHRPYRMPLWPLPPLLALLGCLLVTVQQSLTDIAIVGAILLLGALYYALYLRPRAATHWVMLKPVAADQNDKLTAEALPLNNPGL